MNVISRAKVLLTAAVTGSFLFLTGCFADGALSGTEKSAPGLDGMYSAECEITCTENEEEFVYGGKMTRMGGGSWQLELETPDTVKGLKITVGDDGMNASLGELSFRLETEKIPNRAAFLTVLGVLDSAANGGLRFTETETEFCYKGTYGEENYTLKYEKAGNTLCGLECGSVSAVFTGFSETSAP